MRVKRAEDYLLSFIFVKQGIAGYFAGGERYAG
jgi:hypothetical protein